MEQKQLSSFVSEELERADCTSVLVLKSALAGSATPSQILTLILKIVYILEERKKMKGN